jgi:predicted DNA-binding protein (MmcQ/YjbR family)
MVAALTADSQDRLRAYALSLPGTWEDFPWGERVAKVNKKIFVSAATTTRPNRR